MTQEFDTELLPEELDPERPQPFDTPWGSFTLYLVGGEWRAWQSFCPHMQAPLFGGTRSNDSITCPWHLWRYSLETGEFLDAPEDDETSERGCMAKAGVRTSASGTLVLIQVESPNESR
jgi:nitrite reductase/ring-hydroxylating ferredoxin subunit